MPAARTAVTKAGESSAAFYVLELFAVWPSWRSKDWRSEYSGLLSRGAPFVGPSHSVTASMEHGCILWTLQIMESIQIYGGKLW